MYRKGLTLLEIVLSLALAGVALSLLTQLVWMGNRAAAFSRDQTKAQLIAQSVMAEFTSGVAEPASTSGDWLTDPSWQFGVDVTPSASGTMYIITVTATHNVETNNPASFKLTQWLAIPPEPMEEEEDAALEGGV